MSQNPLLRVQSLTVSFGREANAAPVVRNVSFQLSKGETLALVGESGSGKSVTAHAIMRLLPYPFAWHPPESEIWFDGQQLLASDADGRVADAHYILPCEGTAIHPAIEDDEVVA